MNKLLPAFFIAVYFISCQSSGQKNELVVGNYFISTPDNSPSHREQRWLTYRYDAKQNLYTGVIPACVVAIGHSNKYIIAMQHPVDNKTTVFYYIVLIEDTLTPPNSSILFGPMTFNQFGDRRRELNISDSLKFSDVYNNSKLFN
jgi:hypothetical protein